MVILSKTTVIVAFCIAYFCKGACAKDEAETSQAMEENLRHNAREGNKPEVERLLKKGVNVNAVDEDGKSALHLASRNGHVEVVKVLLNAGAKVNLINKNDWSALHLASRHEHVEVVKVLLDAGADVNLGEKDGWSALLYASRDGRVEVVKVLLNGGAKVNLIDKDGWSALHLASYNGQIEVVKVLLNAGADVNLIDKENKSALHIAFNGRHFAVVEVLLAAGAVICLRDKQNVTDLTKALQNCSTERDVFRQNVTDLSKERDVLTKKLQIIFTACICVLLLIFTVMAFKSKAGAAKHRSTMAEDVKIATEKEQLALTTELSSCTAQLSTFQMELATARQTECDLKTELATAVADAQRIAQEWAAIKQKYEEVSAQLKSVLSDQKEEKSQGTKLKVDREVAELKTEKEAQEKGTPKLQEPFPSKVTSAGKIQDSEGTPAMKTKDILIQQLEESLHFTMKELAETEEKLRKEENLSQQYKGECGQIRREHQQTKMELQQATKQHHLTMKKLAETEAVLSREENLSQQYKAERDQTRREHQQTKMELQQATKQQGLIQEEYDQARRELEALRDEHSKCRTIWIVPRHQVTVLDTPLGGGAWGYVREGSFKGQRVAVKCIYDSIITQHTIKRVYREICTMAQVHHPNLVQFIATVLDDQGGPMIVTELLDTTLRKAYEDSLLKPGLDQCVDILCDVASALSYLHELPEPIIHRDVSSNNVLLKAMAQDKWKAKLSDFGSANWTKEASTMGEGAIVYTAPEAYPSHPSLHHTPPPQQTTKIDVYSYGILLCEVVLRRFPDPAHLQESQEELKAKHVHLHSVMVRCTHADPAQRPSMADVLNDLGSVNRI